ncbi:Uncharacterised protein [Serratia fonticola]|uniref:Uncharacterized protein n=1 Tax=Serratia fonticola TaxID=47917 RepID=A0A4U9W1I5_SERFO|nr:Uncharacterised protein [Serratia fonticola]
MNGTLRYRTLACLLCGVLVTLPLRAGASNTAHHYHKGHGGCPAAVYRQ